MKLPLRAAAARARARLGRALAPLCGGPTNFMRIAYLTPREAVLITAEHAGERALWPVDWHMPVGFDPPRYALAFGRDGHGTGILLRAGAFVVNTVPATWEPTILAAGRMSGRDGDKISALGLASQPATFVRAPRLSDAIGRLECSVEDARNWDDRVLVVARVLHAEEGKTPRLFHEWRA